MSQPINPVTIVTGGSRGIGAAIALRLVSAGHDLVLGYVDNLLAAERTAEAVAEHDVRCVVVRADVASEEDVSRLFGAADEVGQVTGLVNNAGLTAHIGPLADTPEDVIRRVIDVNLLGVVLCARRAAQVMSPRSTRQPAPRIGRRGRDRRYLSARPENPTRSLPRWPGCSGRTPATSAAPYSGSPAGSEQGLSVGRSAAQRAGSARTQGWTAQSRAAAPILLLELHPRVAHRRVAWPAAAVEPAAGRSAGW
jgi:NAD(P)-dependent dehydrogenase (short-subunit alcohol dehydrogenase family)